MTATTATPHGLATGANVMIAGANQAWYNGTWVVTVTGATTFTYTGAGPPRPASPATETITATLVDQGLRRFQVVRVPQYTTATLGPSLTASYWDGSSGGILAFDVQGALALGSTTVSVSGRGSGGWAPDRDGQAVVLPPPT